MPKISLTKFEHLTDPELVKLIQENQEYIGEVYKRCKKNSLFYMRKTTSNSMNDDVYEDIFQNAIIVLYEKIKSGNFVLTVKIQTYIDKVCYNQILNQYKDSQKTIPFPDESNSSIIDVLVPIENTKEPKFIAIEKALEKMKSSGGRCYELLILFWYQKKTMEEIALIRNYTNSDNAKSQKSKCQQELKTMAFNELNK